MRTETYKGRKLKVRVGRKSDWGKTFASVNGTPVFLVEKFDEEKALAELRRDVDTIDQVPVDGDRNPAYWYAPGTYILCVSGHPVALGGECLHFTCREERSAA